MDELDGLEKDLGEHRSSEYRLLTALLFFFGLRRANTKHLPQLWPILSKLLLLGLFVTWMTVGDVFLWYWVRSSPKSPWIVFKPLSVFVLLCGELVLNMVLTHYFYSQDLDTAINHAAHRSPQKAIRNVLATWAAICALYCCCMVTLAFSAPPDTTLIKNIALATFVRLSGFAFHAFLTSGIMLGGFVFILLCQIQRWEVDHFEEELVEAVQPLPKLLNQHVQLRGRIKSFSTRWQTFLLLFTFTALIDLFSSLTVIINTLRGPQDHLNIASGWIVILFIPVPVCVYLASILQLLACSSITSASDRIRDTATDLLVREGIPKDAVKDAIMYFDRTSCGFVCYGFRIDPRVIASSAALVVSAVPIISAGVLSTIQ